MSKATPLLDPTGEQFGRGGVDRGKGRREHSLAAWSKASHVALAAFSLPRRGSCSFLSWVRRIFLGCLFAWLCTNWAFLAALESDPLKGSFLAYYVVVLSMNLLPPLSIVCGLGAFTPAFIEALCTRLRHLSSLGPMTREEVIADVRSVALIAVGAAPVYFSALISYQIVGNNDGPGMGSIGQHMNMLGAVLGPGKYAAPLIHTAVLILYLRAYKRELALLEAAHTERADAHLASVPLVNVEDDIEDDAAGVLWRSGHRLESLQYAGSAASVSRARPCCGLRGDGGLCCGGSLKICVWNDEGAPERHVARLVQQERVLRRRVEARHEHLMARRRARQRALQAFDGERYLSRDAHAAPAVLPMDGSDSFLLGEREEGRRPSGDSVGSGDEEGDDLGVSPAVDVGSRREGGRAAVTFIHAHKNTTRFYGTLFKGPFFQLFVSIVMVLNMVMVSALVIFLASGNPAEAFKVDESQPLVELTHIAIEWGTLFACFWALMGAIANANAATMSLKRAVNRSIRLYGVDDRLMVRLYLQGASNSPFALMGGMPITWGLVSRFTYASTITATFALLRFVRSINH